MSADLFSPADVPFNLAGETLSNELTQEGERRAKAEAEANQKKRKRYFGRITTAQVYTLDRPTLAGS